MSEPDLKLSVDWFMDLMIRGSLPSFAERQLAFSIVHEVLAAGNELCDIAAYLTDLSGELDAGYLRPWGVVFNVHADEAELPDRVCECLGLVVAEFAARAIMATDNSYKVASIQTVYLRRRGFSMFYLSSTAVPQDVTSKLGQQAAQTVSARLAHCSGSIGSGFSLVIPD
ncbi:hypothetical protein [Microvirga calopogonii]|uniref:hypothetical protein n=1 Tax=Microvirga calopogonii TaxID=2078013 RepID=UPI0013B35CCE|nr:hypothetical protein [Microvirga calopogonii]